MPILLILLDQVKLLYHAIWLLEHACSKMISPVHAHSKVPTRRFDGASAVGLYMIIRNWSFLSLKRWIIRRLKALFHLKQSWIKRLASMSLLLQ